MNSKSIVPLFVFLTLFGLPGWAQAQSQDDGSQKQGENPTGVEEPRKIAERIRNDLRLIDAAIDQWAIEHNKTTGTPVAIKELAEYFKAGSSLQKAAEAGRFLDALGNPITVVAVDTLPAVSRKTFDQLAAVASAGFWDPYPVK